MKECFGSTSSLDEDIISLTDERALVNDLEITIDNTQREDSPNLPPADLQITIDNSPKVEQKRVRSENAPTLKTSIPLSSIVVVPPKPVKYRIPRVKQISEDVSANDKGGHQQPHKQRDDHRNRIEQNSRASHRKREDEKHRIANRDRERNHREVVRQREADQRRTEREKRDHLEAVYRELDQVNLEIEKRYQEEYEINRHIQTHPRHASSVVEYHPTPISTGSQQRYCNQLDAKQHIPLPAAGYLPQPQGQQSRDPRVPSNYVAVEARQNIQTCVGQAIVPIVREAGYRVPPESQLAGFPRQAAERNTISHEGLVPLQGKFSDQLHNQSGYPVDVRRNRVDVTSAPAASSQPNQIVISRTEYNSLTTKKKRYGKTQRDRIKKAIEKKLRIEMGLSEGSVQPNEAASIN